MKRLADDENSTPPVILPRHQRPRLTLIQSNGDEVSSPGHQDDRIWLLSALDAQTTGRNEEPA
jgi:hypothetical protein